MVSPPLVELSELRRRVGAIDVACLQSSELRSAAQHARAIESAATALVALIGQQANRRHAERLAAEREAAGSGAAADAGAAGAAAGSAEGEAASGAEEALRDPTVPPRRAREDLARATIASTFPGFAEALAEGSIAVGHLDAVHWAIHRRSPELRQALVDRSRELLRHASRNSPRQFARIVDRIISSIDLAAALDRALDQRARSEFSTWISPDGMGHFRGVLDPERFAAFVGAIDAEAAAIVRQAERDGLRITGSANLSAAALFDLTLRGAGSVAGHPGQDGPPGSGGRRGSGGRPIISIHVDGRTATSGPHAGTTCETEDGMALAYETYERHACDAVVRRVLLDENGLPLDVGREHRTATDAQWTALRSIYSHCGWHHCDQPVSRCQAHHIIWWSDLGTTDLGQLVPLCTAHHHCVHEGHWRLILTTDRTLQIFEPDGTHWADARPDRLATTVGGSERASPINDAGGSG